MQVYAGMSISNTRTLGIPVKLSTCGLPKIIPVEHRKRIRNGDLLLIRLWLSWFSIYRVLTIPSELKLSTILDPGVPINLELNSELYRGMKMFVRKVLSVTKDVPLLDPKFVPLSSTTPTISHGRNKVS